MSTRKKIKLTFYVHPAQAESLKKISTRTGIPISVMIRDGLDMAIKKYKKKK